MEYIEILKNQHVDILGLINKLSSNLTGQKTAQSPVEIHNLLSKLSEKLKLHIDMENEILYPDLLDHPDRTIKEQVKKYIKDMDMPREEVVKKFTAKIPLKRLAYIEDVVAVTQFLAGPGSEYMTGQAINVTGGREMH